MNNESLALSRQALRVFVGHYRHSPLQAGAILLGITLAVMLLTGVKATNENAIHSYSQASELLSQRARLIISPAVSTTGLDESLYFKLRRAGFSQSLAVVSGRVADDLGRRWEIQGSDLIAALSLNSSSDRAPGSASDDSERASVLGTSLPLARLLSGEPLVVMSRSQAERIAPGGSLTLSGTALSVIALDDNFGLGSALLMDISLAQRLLDMPASLSYIAIFEPDNAAGQALELRLERQLRQWQLAERVTVSTQDEGEALISLTRSFHLNLSAMSLLAFVVGLFIAYNGVRYSLLKRQRLLVQLLQQGLPRGAVMTALMCELLLLVALGSVMGFILGLQLSHWLQPMVSMTLEQLYGARLMPGIWQWQWLLQAFSLTLVAAILACLPLYLNLSGQPLARNATRHSQASSGAKIHRIQFALAVLLLSVAAVVFPLSQRYEFSLFLMGLVLVAIPLLLPYLLRLATSLLARITPKGLWHYLVCETRELISPLSLAMMAMLLAITANISMNTLVGSFEITLTNWLDARLHADIYLRPQPDRIDSIASRLEQTPGVSRVYRQWSHQGRYRDAPVDLFTRDRASLVQTSQFKQAEPDFWAHFFEGKRLMISEPLAIKHHLKLGQTISLPVLERAGITGMRVGAIFYDYGNPTGQIVIPPKLWQRADLPARPTNLAADYSGSVQALETLLKDELQLPEADVFNQAKIKHRALAIFNKTFSITQVLNSLTLMVAAIGLFSACLMLTQARIAPLARLYALGVTKTRLRLMVLVQMLLIVLLTCIIALPTGALLGYLLINKVTLLAFGWSIAMVWDWGAYFNIVAIALASCLIAVSLPLYWQTRRPLVGSLQQESL